MHGLASKPGVRSQPREEAPVRNVLGEKQHFCTSSAARKFAALVDSTPSATLTMREVSHGELQEHTGLALQASGAPRYGRHVFDDRPILACMTHPRSVDPVDPVVSPELLRFPVIGYSGPPTL